MAGPLWPGSVPGCQTTVMSLLASSEVQALLADAAGRAGRYLVGLDQRPVAPDDAALAGLARFDEPLPEVAGDPATTLALLDEAGSAATVASAGGRYFGFVIGGSYPVAVAANSLATAWDQDVALPVMSPVAARLHEVVTAWLAELFGLPADDQGRMRADCLPEDVTGPAVICAQAGEVNTGAFDPFPAIVEWARRHQAWVHVDGAFGLWALTDPSRSHLTAGLADADSWATDGHKWLNVPMTAVSPWSGAPETSAGASPRTRPTCLPIGVSRPRITPPSLPSAPGRSRSGRSCARSAGRA
jgi:hypothetical protein